VATGPGPRVTDADREAAAARLREHYAQGRLTLEEFHHRLDAVFEATTQAQLTAITRDLPRTKPPAPLPSAATGNGRERGGREHRPRSRARLVVIPVIVAALAAWLLVSGLQLGIFTWPGRLALFLMIFAAIRWLIRFLWGLARGGGPIGGRR
jgi:pyruvate/2-oxoglutarate dehydrogenase complex dihydrolipoamide acyltransferase (E2) component